MQKKYFLVYLGYVYQQNYKKKSQKNHKSIYNFDQYGTNIYL